MMTRFYFFFFSGFIPFTFPFIIFNIRFVTLSLFFFFFPRLFRHAVVENLCKRRFPQLTISWLYYSFLFCQRKKELGVRMRG